MPKKYSTPGFYSSEKDISGITVPAGTSTGAIIITAKNGPVNRFVTISDDKSFIETFGEPIYTSGVSTDRKIPEYGYSAYAALEFLKYSNNLNVLRIAHADDRYANAVFNTSAIGSNSSSLSADTTPTALDRVDSISALDSYEFLTNDVILIGALGPGTDAHDVAVGIEFYSSACDWRYSFDTYSADTSAMTNAQKVFKLNVYTKSGKESWTSSQATALSAYEPVESFYGTIRQQTDLNGTSLQIEEVVNGNSSYIYVKLPLALNEFNLDEVPSINVSDVVRKYVFRSLQGGAATTENTGLTTTAGYSLMNSKEDVDIDILICPTSDTTVKKAAAEVAAIRKDCIVVTQSGTRLNLTVATVKAAEAYGYTSPSYVALYAGWDLVYDSFNDRKVYLPKCIFGAAAMARTDSVANVWDAPAGYNRGIIGPSLDQNKVFSFSEIGQLYDVNINTSRLVRGVGNILWGQKTAQLQNSALDRINVRRLLLFIETSIEESLNPYVLDITNTEKNRLRVWSTVDSFLATVKADGGLTAYSVVCNSTNNTSQVIDSNQLLVDVYVQPVKVVEFIQLQTIVTRTGVNFNEIIG